MAAKRRRKSSRQLGSGTYGWGKNKHRNSGQRGGYGNAGSGKKCDSKKPSNWAQDDYFGKFGFVSKGQVGKLTKINLRDVDDLLACWTKENKVGKEGSVVVVDLTKLGYEKLLSSGQLRSKVKIIVANASNGAKEKVKAAGGELVVHEQ